MHYAEYGVIWVTFLLINLVGLELGMASGVLIAMFTFILDYAKQPVVARVTLRSNVMRSPALSAYLTAMMPQVIHAARCRIRLLTPIHPLSSLPPLLR